MRKERNPRIEAATQARIALFVPFVMSLYGALGARANAFLKQVFGFVKKEGRLGMRSSHPRRASIWFTTCSDYLVLHFLAATDLHGCYGDERRLSR